MIFCRRTKFTAQTGGSFRVVGGWCVMINATLKARLFDSECEMIFGRSAELYRSKLTDFQSGLRPANDRENTETIKGIEAIKTMKSWAVNETFSRM